MGKQALILTDIDHGLDAPEWSSGLVDHGFAVWSRSVHNSADLDEVEASADILMLDLLDVPEEDVDALVRKATEFRKKHGFQGARIPLVAIANPSISLTETQLQPFADLLQPPLTTELISNRLISLMRLATMRREAERRSKTFKKFGVGLPVVPPPRDLDRQSLLFIGEGMAFLPIQVALPETCDVVAAFSPSMAEMFLGNRTFDAIIVELRDYSEHLVDFITDLRRNPDYFSLPIILVCHKRATKEGLAGLAAGANDIVSFPFSESFFENRIDILVREERYRQQLKKIFSEARMLMPTDSETRLYSEEFLKCHLEGLIEDTNGASITFAGIDIHFEHLDGGQIVDMKQPGLIGSVGRLIASLMRAEDILARLDNGHFVAFFPDTDLMEARMALQRVRSIVQLSPFMAQGSNETVNVTLDFSLHCTETGRSDIDIDRILKDLFENPVTRF